MRREENEENLKRGNSKENNDDQVMTKVVIQLVFNYIPCCSY